MPSQSIERIWARLVAGNLFIMNIMLKRFSIFNQFQALPCFVGFAWLSRLIDGSGSRIKRVAPGWRRIHRGEQFSLERRKEGDAYEGRGALTGRGPEESGPTLILFGACSSFG